MPSKSSVSYQGAAIMVVLNVTTFLAIIYKCDHIFINDSDHNISLADIPLTTSTLILIKWKDSQGQVQKFRLINRVSAGWRNFGLILGHDTNLLDGWEDECRNKADRCWCKVMEHWLTEKDEAHYPTTWKGLFTLLEDAEYCEVAIELHNALASILPPSSQ